MNRLTDGIYTFKDKIEDIENDYLLKVQKKLAYYEDLVEQGRLIELPCKVGNIIYIIQKNFIYQIYEKTVSKILIRSDIIQIICADGIQYNLCFEVEDFGDIIFLTRESAENKLKEMNNV